MKTALLTWAEQEIDARRDHRLEIFLPVKLLWAGTRRSAQIVNISQSGAKLYCAITPSHGDLLGIEWQGKLILGRCVWSRSHLAGIAFEERLTDEQMRAMIA
ncbi:PilZ domain-containing protein [Sphingobium phenoxybenzoativorans]|uniref:PilZ domain-containing protein n=1 Tax=Sphingobium phenoxybenzoativorans TaxID=1592790 RepID=A0A975K3V1_9SPHN|nr:PilZ domain-containing protein [Sphingobium phenoxybenzoativorans]QUT03904.1 PilZ domain-containing protein [Sphingobium phenoxybenzoativorans]